MTFSQTENTQRKKNYDIYIYDKHRDKTKKQKQTNTLCCCCLWKREKNSSISCLIDTLPVVIALLREIRCNPVASNHTAAAAVVTKGFGLYGHENGRNDTVIGRRRWWWRSDHDGDGSRRGGQ
jgi:hypothetical protein